MVIRAVETNLGLRYCGNFTNIVTKNRFSPVQYEKFRIYSMNSFEDYEQYSCNSIKKLTTALKNARYYVNGSRKRLHIDCKTIPYDTSALSRSCIDIRGDSFTRHMLQTVSMIKTGNFASGGRKRHAEMCMCDGQFSEHIGCRSNLNMPLKCSIAPGKTICFSSKGCVNRTRLVWIQHGPKQIAHPERFSNQLESTSDRDVLVVIGAVSQTKEADNKFPLQSYARSLSFNN